MYVDNHNDWHLPDTICADNYKDWSLPDNYKDWSMPVDCPSCIDSYKDWSRTGVAIQMGPAWGTRERAPERWAAAQKNKSRTEQGRAGQDRAGERQTQGRTGQGRGQAGWRAGRGRGRAEAGAGARADNTRPIHV